MVLGSVVWSELTAHQRHVHHVNLEQMRVVECALILC